MTLKVYRTQKNRFKVEFTGEDGRTLVDNEVDAWQLLNSAEDLIHAVTGVVVSLDANGNKMP